MFQLRKSINYNFSSNFKGREGGDSLGEIRYQDSA